MANFTAAPHAATPVPESRQEFLRDQTVLSGPNARSEGKGHMAVDLSVDEHGKICYYGPTSAVHDPPQEDSPMSVAPTSGSSSTRAEMSSYLASYVRESAAWEDFALRNAALETGIPHQVMAKLLHLHWTWVAPMFMWTYRPAFIREFFVSLRVTQPAAYTVANLHLGDMTTGGRYYSEFLLTVICAHAAKYHEPHYAEPLLARSRRLLGSAIQEPSSIPTVQALLQLSARDVAHGQISQAWVYSGIAFRMASDLGLQHSSQNIKGLKPVDLEVRRRLFWSCYFWDK